MKKNFGKVKSVFKLKRCRFRYLPIIALYLLSTGFPMVAGTYATSQMITLNLKNTTLREIIEEIKSQSEFSFSIEVSDLNLEEEISLSVDNKTIHEILPVLLEGKGVSYQIDDKHIIIVPSVPVNSTTHLPSPAQETRRVSGRVVDQNGEEIIGANIMVKGTQLGVVTDIDGNFELQVPPNAILQISYVGYMTRELEVGNQTVLSIVLTENLQALEEVVVIGYGTQKKVNLTGAVSAVSGEELTKRPVANAVTMLQGQIPGLRVSQELGVPGSEGTTLRVRGQGTFSSAGSDPLILINGVPGSLTNLDPSVIESVSVLKDAASAAIYGARAANGVILVTTKQGSGSKKASVSYHMNLGLYSASKLYDLVTNSVEYMELFNQARTNSGITGLYSDDIINQYRNNPNSEQYPSFDWLDYMFNTALVQTHNLNVAGSSEKNTYNISLNYVNQPGTMRGFEYKKYNVTVDLASQVNDFIRVGTYTSMMYGEREEPRQGQEDAMLATLSQAPTYKPWLPDDGSGVTRWTYRAYTFEEGNKNVPAIIGTNTLKNYNNFDVNGQLWMQITPFKGLSWYVKGAARLISNKTKDWLGIDEPVYLYHTGEQAGILDKGQGLQETDNRNFYTNLFTTLTYDFSLNDRAHNFNIMVGYNQESQKNQELKATRKYYSFDLHTIDAGSQTDWTNGGSESEWAIMSGFGRLMYNFKERYLFEANMRYDGTSRIASENRWGIFPSFSAAWRLSEENFMKSMNLEWLNNAKIRGSWGKLGNQNIGTYPYQALIVSVDDYPFDKTNMTTAYHQNAYANRNLKWESTAITNIGVDLQLFRGLSMSFEWYNKQTTGILRSSQVNALLGLTAPYVNEGEMQNRGVELTVNWNDRIRNGALKGLDYHLGFNLDRTRNKLKKWGTVTYDSYYIREEGLPYQEYYMLECIGVFATQEEIDNSPKQYNDNTLPGDLKYRDVNGDGKIDNDDRIPISGKFPGFEYAVTGGASWKNFDLSFIGQGVSGKKYYTNQWGVQPFQQGSAPTRDYLKGMWTEENPYGATHPRLYFANMGGTKNSRPNTYYLKDASYFRLRNLTVGYTLPRHLIQKAYLSNVRVYFSGDNLLTFTKYTGIDPERGNDGDGRDVKYPQNRICSFGINVEF